MPYQQDERCQRAVPVRLLRWLFCLYAAALTAAMLWPMGSNVTRLVEPAIGNRPRLAHLLALAVLAVLVWLARLPIRGRTLLVALMAYGVLGEAAQVLIPGRTATWQDAAANLLGIALGLAVAWAAEAVLGRRDDGAHLSQLRRAVSRTAQSCSGNGRPNGPRDSVEITREG
jgi:hypothetical protein